MGPATPINLVPSSWRLINFFHVSSSWSHVFPKTKLKTTLPRLCISKLSTSIGFPDAIFIFIIISRTPIFMSSSILTRLLPNLTIPKFLRQFTTNFLCSFHFSPCTQIIPVVPKCCNFIMRGRKKIKIKIICFRNFRFVFSVF